MSGEKLNWLRIAFQFRGSVIPAIWKRVLFCGIFGSIISVLFYFQLPVYWKGLESVIPSIVLGLLLVFRTNTAYDRFWEGRKCWGSLVNNIRNLARSIWVAVIEKEPSDRSSKAAVLKLLVAFAVATKLHLRSEPPNEELKELISPSRYWQIKNLNNPPLEIAFWIGDYLQQQYESDRIDLYQLNSLNSLLNSMVDALGGCERILKTPIPLAYAIHLKQLLLIYCLLLPFQLVNNLGWLTGPVVGLISFTLFGIEEIGIEIENPFGHDRNDLPLDAICNNLKRNTEDLIALSVTDGFSPKKSPGVQKLRSSEF